MRDTDDGAHTIEIAACLETFEILYRVDNRIVHFIEADSLTNPVPYLTSLDFDALMDK